MKNEKGKINEILTNTWESIEMLQQQYIDSLTESDFEHPKTRKIINFVLDLGDYHKTIMILFMEYASYRKVAEETNVSHLKIFKDIKKLKKQIKCL